jgi:hypothetical protein
MRKMAAQAVQVANPKGMLGLAAGMSLAGVAAGRLLFAPRRMPHLDVWQRGLAKTHGEVQAAMLAARVQARYDELYAHRPVFSNWALRAHLERRILPGVALYQVLFQEIRDRHAALAQVEALFETGFARTRKLMPLLARLPDPFATLRAVARLVVRLGFPRQGWEIEVSEDTPRSFAFSVHRCFYLNVLMTYGAPELARLYCKTDDLLFSQLPSSITWARTGTLGRGDAACDFRWCRHQINSNSKPRMEPQPVSSAL